MNAPFNSRVHRRKPSVNLTSLIDVMFLLLIFFMVSSTFRDQFGVDITLPQAETGVEQDSSTHTITIGKKGNMFFEDRPVNDQQLRTAILAMLQQEPEATLVLKADEKTNFGRVIRAIDIARAAGGTRLVVPTRPLEGPNPESPAPTQVE